MTTNFTVSEKNAVISISSISAINDRAHSENLRTTEIGKCLKQMLLRTSSAFCVMQ